MLGDRQYEKWNVSLKDNQIYMELFTEARLTALCKASNMAVPFRQVCHDTRNYPVVKTGNIVVIFWHVLLLYALSNLNLSGENVTFCKFDMLSSDFREMSMSFIITLGWLPIHSSVFWRLYDKIIGRQNYWAYLFGWSRVVWVIYHTQTPAHLMFTACTLPIVIPTVIMACQSHHCWAWVAHIFTSNYLFPTPMLNGPWKLIMVEFTVSIMRYIWWA